MEVREIEETASRIISSLNKAIIGYEKELRLILVALLSNGHVLLEGVPGIAKTTAVKGLAKLIGLDAITKVEIERTPYRGLSRVQCTPDLMPADITGSLIYNPKDLRFEPRFGPVFSYILLVDEINRAIPRTQSALLQAMQEREVTIGDRTYKLEYRERGKFFFVLATQNPVEYEGTYPLPEAQLDRFLMRILMEYPDTLEEEKQILRLHMARLSEPIEELEKVVEPEWIIHAQEAIARRVSIPEPTLEYITRGIRYTRPEMFEPVRESLLLGASPRAGIYLMRAAKVHAALRGSEEVLLEDVDAVAPAVLNHRLIPNPEKLVELRMSGEVFTSSYKIVKEALELAMRTAKKEL
ncbi:MAG TPA: ATPase [Candidatus Korarchaeota archaeon]|nr:ATPase [Candidatus Korarchaeota archaeon]